MHIHSWVRNYKYLVIGIKMDHKSNNSDSNTLRKHTQMMSVHKSSCCSRLSAVKNCDH